MKHTLSRRSSVAVALAAATIALGACSSGNDSPTPAASSTDDTMTEEAMTDEAMTEEAMTDEAMTDEAMSEQYCSAAADIGSVSSANADAMAMSPAESAQDFAALAEQFTALGAAAPTPEVKADVTTVVAHLDAEEMMMAGEADGTSDDSDGAAVAAGKADSDAAVVRIISSVQQECGVDIS